uniref:Asteroid domain-containing protein n=1 Tax=Anopheles epiroticus TaxID=199890 RepID=A0A182PJG2_9DIPT
MGVRYLHSFMEQKVNGGIYMVNMQQEILKAKKRIERPLIVFDLMALFGLFCSDRHSLLCGSQYWVVEYMADTFFKRLTDLGAELVFFYDGTLQTSKYDTWITRQNDKYDRMIDIIDAIDAGVPVTVVAKKFDRTMPSNTCIKLQNVAKRHGKLITANDLECDQAVAIFATKNKALAVVSHDTDFLIFEGSWQLWHAEHINLQKLSTKAYNRQALIGTLGLQWYQMAVWATLAGNDWFKYDEVLPFLNDLGPHSQKMYRLADYVRRLPMRNKKLDEDGIQCVLGRVYRKRRMPAEAYELFRQSVAFYQVDEHPENERKHTNDPFAYLLQAEHFFTYSILTGEPFNVTLFFFDYRSNEFGKYHEIVEPIISRIGGILLYHHRHERQHVTVMMKRHHKESNSFGDVPVTYPSAITPPPVRELIAKDENEPPGSPSSLLSLKLQLWRWVCSDDLLHDERFNGIPSAFMCTVLTLYRLRQCGAIRIFEADLLLVIAQQLSTRTFDPLQEPSPQRLISRAFRLAFLFQKVYGHMERVSKALGLPDEYRPTTPYDGHRFHNMYRVWAGRKVESQDIAPIVEWRIYAHASQST